jgi:hypothetical protein
MKLANPCFGNRNFEAASNQDPSRKDTTAILQLNNLRVTLFELAAGFFFCGEISPPGDNKKGLANSTKGFWRIFIKKSPYLENKKVRSRQI